MKTIASKLDYRDGRVCVDLKLKFGDDLLQKNEKFKEWYYPEEEEKKKRILRIINHFGVDNQKIKFGEECDELKEAIIIHELKKSVEYEIPLTELIDTREHIVEETTDVLHVLLQIILYYGITRKEIEKVLWFKNDRTNEIVDDEIRKG